MRILFLLLVFATSLMACRSGRDMAAVDPPPPPPVREPVVVDPEPEPEPEPEIPVVEEKFDFEREEDRVTQEVNRYFVILGSFRVHDNANRFKSALEQEGFTPVILLSETGFNRVSVDSYTSETDARQRVMQIRRSFPQYHDSWLLIRR
ncbi:MAG: SPOR domain-containing protein [Marinilabiliales bacterium]|nr:MAG: SPOR domain-containing protein [Marinilabiliales bacterium]